MKPKSLAALVACALLAPARAPAAVAGANVIRSIDVGEAGGRVEVAITATDDSSGVGEIRYTRDGSEPTAASTLYTGPFGVAKTTTLRYRAWDTAGNAEAAPASADATTTLATRRFGGSGTTPPPSNAFVAAGHAARGRAGEVLLALRVPGPGWVGAFGTQSAPPQVRSARRVLPDRARIGWAGRLVAVTRAGVVRLTLKPNARGRRVLARARRLGRAVYVRVTTVYTPTAGRPRLHHVQYIRVLAAHPRVR
jgi:hypothetical protein